MEAAGDDQKVEPKKRNRPLLNLLKSNPLAGSTEKGDGTAKHLPGLGKHPVRDIVKRVLGGDDDDKEQRQLKQQASASAVSLAGLGQPGPASAFLPRISSSAMRATVRREINDAPAEIGESRRG